jgi:hypothetical protein
MVPKYNVKLGIKSWQFCSTYLPDNSIATNFNILGNILLVNQSTTYIGGLADFKIDQSCCQIGQ